MSSPTEQEALDVYVTRCAQLARSIPVPEARLFLRGALMLAGDHESVDDLRIAYYKLVDAEVILEPIASGQLRLALTLPPPPVVGDLTGRDSKP